MTPPEASEPAVLVCLRWEDMIFTHPEMIERTCSKCKQAVAVFPAGQKVLQNSPGIGIMCDRCCTLRVGDTITTAPGAMEEARETLRRARRPKG